MASSQPPDPLSQLGIRLNPTRRFAAVAQSVIGSVADSADLEPSPSGQGSGQTSIKVLSWNIAKSTYQSGWSKDFSAIIKQYQPDKIFLQEVRLCALSEEIPELKQMGWRFAPNFIDKSENAYSGVLIATRANPIESRALITQHTEPVSNTPKNISVCRILVRQRR